MLKSTENKKKMELYQKEIPEDIAIKILTYVSPDDYSRFLSVCKLFYNSFYKSPFCINFKLRSFLIDNLHHHKENTKLKVLQQMKNQLEIEEGKIRGKKKELHFWRKWGNKYEPGVFQIKSPYTIETSEEIEELMKTFKFVSFKKLEIKDGKELYSKVKLKGIPLIFYYSHVKNYPRTYFWSVKRDNENENLIISFSMNEDSIVGEFEVNVEEIKKEMMFKGSENELIDLLNDIAEIVVEFPCSDYSSSNNIQ